MAMLKNSGPSVKQEHVVLKLESVKDVEVGGGGVFRHPLTLDLTFNYSYRLQFGVEGTELTFLV